MNSPSKISAFRDDSLGSDDTVGLAKKIEKGDLNPQTITQDAIERAQQVNPHLNAIAVEDLDSALERSKDSFTGVFHGIPKPFGTKPALKMNTLKKAENEHPQKSRT